MNLIAGHDIALHHANKLLESAASWDSIGNAPTLSECLEPQLDDEQQAQLYEQACVALNEGQLSQAAQDFSRLAQRRPDEPAYHYGLGVSLQHLGLIEKAGEHLSYAYALDPSDAQTCFRLAECLAALGHLDEAREALRTARQLMSLHEQDQALAPLIDALQERIG